MPKITNFNQEKLFSNLKSSKLYKIILLVWLGLIGFCIPFFGFLIFKANFFEGNNFSEKLILFSSILVTFFIFGSMELKM